MTTLKAAMFVTCRPTSLIRSEDAPIIKGFMAASLGGLVLNVSQFVLGTLQDEGAVCCAVQWLGSICINHTADKTKHLVL